jgi:hypothetical protein
MAGRGKWWMMCIVDQGRGWKPELPPSRLRDISEVLLADGYGHVDARKALDR